MDVSQFTSDGKFLMLALDHRGSIKKLINPQDPDGVTDEQVITLKKEIIDALRDQFSGILLDETYGLEAYPIHNKPFLLPLEKSGFTTQNGERITELEYLAKQLIEYGASGAKLLLYFNPILNSANVQIETARKARGDCRQNSLPLFLEIVTYLAKPGLSTQFQSGIGGLNLVIESVKKLLERQIIPDVWKLEYPGSVDVCRKLTNLVGNIPWVLLTGGDSFAVFQAHLKEAIRSGAKGFLAGRALWQEVCQLQGEEKEQFLKEILPERFKTIAEIAIE